MFETTDLSCAEIRRFRVRVNRRWARKVPVAKQVSGVAPSALLAGASLRLTRHYFLRYRFGDMPVDRWKSLGVTDKQVAEKRALEFRQEKEREAAAFWNQR